MNLLNKFGIHMCLREWGKLRFLYFGSNTRKKKGWKTFRSVSPSKVSQIQTVLFQLLFNRA